MSPLGPRGVPFLQVVAIRVLSVQLLRARHPSETISRRRVDTSRLSCWRSAFSLENSASSPTAEERVTARLEHAEPESRYRDRRFKLLSFLSVVSPE